MRAEIGDLGMRGGSVRFAAMILTCPECATSYFVDDSVIGEGRAVRCASCGSSWRANAPRPPLELKVTPHEGAMGHEPAVVDEDLFQRPVSELPAPALPKAFRAKTEADRRMREAALQGAVWAAMGAAVALLVALAVVFRIEVVRLWPKAASAYASLGLPVNAVGLGIEGVRAQMALREGHPALVVSGVLRNVRAKPIAPPPLSIALLDKGGRRLMTRTALAGEEAVPPGQTRAFSIAVVDPPPAATNLDVTFVLTSGSPRAQPPKLRPAAEDPKAMLAGPIDPAPAPPAQPAAAVQPPDAARGAIQVQDAKPLPASSPYALPAASEAR